MWKITPLDLASFRLTASATQARRLIRHNPGTISQIPCIAYLLTRLEDGVQYLVDSGPSPDSERDSRLHGSISRSSEQQLENALQRNGSSLEKIHTVILTHLHWDHALGVLELPHARVIVQRTELQYAAAPGPQERASYEHNDISTPPYFFRYHHQIEVVDGDMELEEGIRLISLPGHSPGSQGVVVTTPQGDWCITGDLVDSYHNFEEQLPSGVYGRLNEFYESMQKVRGLKARLLPSHDYRHILSPGIGKSSKEYVARRGYL